MKRLFRRPSPAMVVAIVALIAALGGTAVAGGFITKKKAKNIANNVVTQRAPGLSVASAKTADSATNADSVGGKKVVTFNSNGGSPTLVSLGGMTLTCNAGVVTLGTTTDATVANVSIDTITDNDTDNRTFGAAVAAGGSRTVVGGAGVTEPDTVSQSAHVYYRNTAGNVVNVDFNEVSGCNIWGVAYGG